jgi:hypothetical protein
MVAGLVGWYQGALRKRRPDLAGVIEHHIRPLPGERTGDQ